MTQRISFFKNAKSTNKEADITISFLINSIKDGKWKDLIEGLRTIDDKKERSQYKSSKLPAVTISGIFTQSHKEEDFKEHSGLIQIDIDNIENTETLKTQLYSDPFTFIGFVSPSGTGIKLIVKIDSKKHKDSFFALEKYYLETYDITIDKACKDVSRLCFISYDPEIYINESAPAFEVITNEKINSTNVNKINNDETSKIEKLIQKINDNCADITNDYQDWLKIGFAIADEFGESGFKYFDQISALSSKYEPLACRRQYDSCLKDNIGKTGISTLYYLAKQSGIELYDNAKSSNKIKNTPQKNDESNDTSENIAEKARIIKIRDYIFERYDFRFNSTTLKLEFKKKDEGEYIEFMQKHRVDIIVELKSLRMKSPKEDVEDILNSSLIPEFSPFDEYFNNIKYKGSGFIEKLANCIILDDLDINIDNKNYKELLHEYFKKWLMACYFCCTGKSINDVMLVLIGAQGRFKTSFLNNLCPKALAEYRVCSHINPSLTDYNTSNYLAEKFLINVDDQMENIFGKDYNAMKAVISAPDVSMRRLYRSDHTRRRRVGNFCGSVNESRFLRDSNNRRYLCFKIKDILPQYSDVGIDELWAEVKNEADKLNSYYIFGKEDYYKIDLLNNNFCAPSEEEEALCALFKPADLTSEKEIYYMQFGEIMKILRTHTSNQQLKPYNLQTAMRKLKFESKSYKKERFGNAPRYLYPVQLLIENNKDKQWVVDQIYTYR